MSTIAGYANRLVSLKFPELSEPGDEIWLAIRNPRLMPPGEMTPRNVAMTDTGQPVDTHEAQLAMYELFAKLIVAGRCYDATANGVDDHGDPVDQPLLTLPFTAETVAKLPMEIINAVAGEFSQAANPR